jgi:hypothetical protein
MDSVLRAPVLARGSRGTWEDRPVVPTDIHDFFTASAGVAGALIGLLFVAMSVSAERLARTGSASQLHRIRAQAALIAFINALAVSLFALLPGEKIGVTTLSVSVVGLVFVLASLLSLVRLRQVRSATVRDGVFFAGLVVIFVVQMLSALSIEGNPHDANSVTTIAILVIVCFLVGIARAWEAIGGPSIGITQEVVALVRGGDPSDAPAEAPAPETPVAGDATPRGDVSETPRGDVSEP